jgi:hypothetical protein
MRNYGQSEWDTNFGAPPPRADFLEMHIGVSRSDGMKKLDSRVTVKESFAQAWRMFSSAAPI